MRVEPYDVGSYMHIVKRGARGDFIVRDEADRYRFLRMLYLLNDHNFDPNWRLYNLPELFSRPQSWPERVPIVEILAYTLMPNHFHIILREVQSGGVTLFMKRLGQSMTNCSNDKYKEQGSLFQGPYRSKTIAEDNYLRYVAAYVMVKNTMELYPTGGLTEAMRNFDDAWNWATDYNFSSFGDYAGVRENSPIVEGGLLKELFTPQYFKSYSRDVILAGKWIDQLKNLE